MTSQKVKDLMLEAWEINGSFGTTDLFPFSEWDGGSNEEPMLTLNERWSVKAYLEVDEDDFVENCWFALVDWDENMEYYIEDDLKLSQSVISYAISRLSKSKKIGARTDYDVRENIKRVYYYAVA